MSRNEREEEAFQSMFDAIKGQSIHAPVVGEDGLPAVAVALGPDGQPLPPVVYNHVPREKEFDDTEVRKMSSRLWLVSFCDLISLMLCFFVMMYSTRDPNMDKLTQMMGGASGLHGGSSENDSGEAGGDQTDVSIAHVEYGEALNLDYLQGILKTALTQSKLQDDVDISNGRDHLKLEIDDPFAGDTSLDADGNRIAKGLADRLNNLSNRITVVAHGGDWDEVAARAKTFAEVMRDGGYRKPFTVIGELTSGPGIEIRVEADDGRAH